ncbi:MAG: PAS domain-containing protein, partial [Pseudomonadota bacterium]
MGGQPAKSSGDDASQAATNEGLVNAIHRVMATIEFELDGTIVSANQNFCDVVGYAPNEITGKHHRMFCDPDYAKSEDYQDFWVKLSQGELVSGEFRRLCKDGSEIWISASYNPIFGADGKPERVVKLATDITPHKVKARDDLLKSTGFESSSSAMMMVDRDFIVTHVNHATQDLLTKNADVFR